MPHRLLAFALTLLLTLTAFAQSQPPKWHPGHYVFIAHSPIKPEHILEHFRGVQRCYAWNKLEPEKGNYDFTSIRADLELLKKHNKQLVIQLQYKAFGKDQNYVPDYIRGPEYGGGIYRANSGSFDPVIWNENVGQRMHALFTALGKEFDSHPNFEAINLPETAPSADLVRSPQPGVQAYAPDIYFQSLKQHMLALRKAFPNTAVIQYANFPPQLLPELTDYMKEIGVGLGGPDVYPRPSPLSDPKRGVYRLYAPLAGIVPLGAAVQYPDYSVANQKRTGAFNKGKDRDSVEVTAEEEQPIPVREHLDLARNTLKLNYLFWAANPKYLENVKTMLAEPDLAPDPAGGLHATPPKKLTLPSP